MTADRYKNITSELMAAQESKNVTDMCVAVCRAVIELAECQYKTADRVKNFEKEWESVKVKLSLAKPIGDVAKVVAGALGSAIAIKYLGM